MLQLLAPRGHRLPTHGGDALAAFAAAEALRSAADEQSRLEAMGLLIYSCAGREVDRDSQTTAAKAGVVPLLAPLVGSGSTHQRMMAANTLLILCFKHADNAALVGHSPAVEAAVANVLAPPSHGPLEPARLALLAVELEA